MGIVLAFFGIAFVALCSSGIAPEVSGAIIVFSAVMMAVLAMIGAFLYLPPMNSELRTECDFFSIKNKKINKNEDFGKKEEEYKKAMKESFQNKL